MIVFHKVLIENFGSIIGPMEYTWDSPGINLIIAPNGSGKTTLISSLGWCLFGQLLKKDATVEPWPEFVKPDSLGTKVEVIFTKDEEVYSVIRCKGYKGKISGYKGGDRVFFYKNHKLLEELRDKRDVNKAIVELLGFSFPLFINTVLFGQKLKRLIQEDGSKRKEVMDEAFEITYIQRAREKAEEKRKDLVLNRSKVETKYLAEKSVHTQLKDTYESQKKLVETHRAQHQKTIQDYESQIRDKELELDKLRASLQGVESSGDIEELTKEIQALESKLKDDWRYEKRDLGVELKNISLTIKNTSKELAELKAKLKNPSTFNCSYCGAKLSASKANEVKAQLLKNIKRLEQKQISQEKAQEVAQVKIQKLDKDANRATKKIAKYKPQITDYQAKKKHNEITQALITRVMDSLVMLQKLLEKIKKEKVVINLGQIRKKIKSKTAELKALQNELAIVEADLELYAWVVKDPLSNTGLKAFIFDQMLSLVNTELEKYQSILGFSIQFGIDLESHRKDFYILITRGKTEVSYYELSGGQQQLVDIAIAFSIHSVVNAEKPCNILIMDEVFESLSEDNIDLVSDLIRVKSRDKSVHVVTHQSRFTPTNAQVSYLKLHKTKGTMYA